jgi:hypothetical protein
LRWLRDLRRVALLTEVDRLPLIPPRVYVEALRIAKGDLMAANHSLVTKGHRLRDQSPHAMESVDALKANLAKRSPEDRADVARELIAEPTVRELLDGEPAPDFGARWANPLVLRINDQTGKLADLVKREGLVFAPHTELAVMLKFLGEAERQIADVRAAVQERIQDAEMGQVM